MSVKSDLDIFLREKKLAGLSSKSLCDYKEFIFPFVNFCGCSFSDLTMDVVNDYFDSLFYRELSKSTIATYVRNVKIFLCWLQLRYDTDINAAAIKVPKSPKKNPHIYSDSEIFQIFDLIYKSDWLSLRNCCIVSLMLDSGLRRNECTTLLWSNLYIDDNYINVLGKGSKERIVPLGSLSKNFLLNYQAACPYSSRYVFVTRSGSNISDNTIKLFMSKYGKQLPFEFSAHKLRHNFATNFLIDNYNRTGHMDIFALMSILGHENIETTKRYLHVANQVVYSKAHISHLDNIFSGGILHNKKST